MSDDEQALTAGILADPDNVLRRLVFADWCDENGQPERAEFIRWQNDRETEPIMSIDELGFRPTILQPEEQGKKATLFNILDHFRPWSKNMWRQMDGCQDQRRRMFVAVCSSTRKTMVFWHRGFVVGVHCSRSSLLGRSIDALARHPVRAVSIDGEATFSLAGHLARSRLRQDLCGRHYPDPTPHLFLSVVRYTVGRRQTTSAVVRDWFGHGILN